MYSRGWPGSWLGTSSLRLPFPRFEKQSRSRLQRCAVQKTLQKKRILHKALATMCYHKHLLRLRKPVETFLLQLDFTTLLRERTRVAAPRRKAIVCGTPTDSVACTDVRASGNLNAYRLGDSTCDQPPTPTYLQDPSIAGNEQGAMNATVGIVSFTPTRERSFSIMQMLEALFAFGVDHAGTPDRPAACQRRSARKDESFLPS